MAAPKPEEISHSWVINATPVVLVESVPSKHIVRCSRVAVSGLCLSRRKLGSYSGARRITVFPSDTKIQICLHRSSMAIGVCIVVTVILFQGMKLLPTGRKSALCGLALGAGSFFLNRLSIFVNFGINQEMHNPVLVFLLVGVILAGAAFGYWLVRKFIIVADDGSVAHFVKWALRVVAVTFIFQSTLDTVLAFGISLFSHFRDATYSSDWSTPSIF